MKENKTESKVISKENIRNKLKDPKIVGWSIFIAVLLLIYVLMDINVKKNTASTYIPINNSSVVASISIDATDEYKYTNFKDLDTSVTYSIPEDATWFEQFDQYLYKRYLKLVYSKKNTDISFEQLYNSSVYDRYYSCGIEYKIGKNKDEVHGK